MSELPDLPGAPVFLPEPMLHYRCNQQGCCCGGWKIPVRRAEVERLLRHLPGLSEEDLVVPGQAPAGLFLRQSESQGRLCCSLLLPDGRCSVRARFGPKALPGVCASFPASAFLVAGRVELRFDTLCPGVLEPILSSTAPVEEVLVPAMRQPGLQRSPECMREVREVRLGERLLSPGQALDLRGAILAKLNDRSRPAIEHLGSILAALARVEAGTWIESFDPGCPFDARALIERFGLAAEQHSPDYLLAELRAYRPFLSPEELDRLRPEEQLADLLRAWQPELLQRMVPQEERLRPYLLRFLWLRFWGVFLPELGPFVFDIDQELEVYALGLRLASAFAGLLDCPVDESLLRPAFGLASFVHHLGACSILQGSRA